MSTGDKHRHPELGDHDAGATSRARGGGLIATAPDWLDKVDPGTHRRIKGLRLVTAYGLAAMLGTMPEIAGSSHDGASLSSLAGNFALWASVSEARATRFESSRDLLLLCAAATLGAASLVLLAPLLTGLGRTAPEALLVTGAFLVGYLKRFGVTGGGVGSQLYIGQLLAFTAGLGVADLPIVAVAGLLAALAAIVPRILSGPAELPVPSPPLAVYSPRGLGGVSAELAMGAQSAIAALAIVALNELVVLQQSVWAITASTYVIAGSTAGTVDRAWRRIVGTMVGVPLALVCLPLVAHAPLLLWAAAAVAMIVYAMALPERYDIACGAFAFTLLVTLAATGEHSVSMLAARAWETIIGVLLGLAAAMLVLPLRRFD